MGLLFWCQVFWLALLDGRVGGYFSRLFLTRLGFWWPYSGCWFGAYSFGGGFGGNFRNLLLDGYYWGGCFGVGSSFRMREFELVVMSFRYWKFHILAIHPAGHSFELRLLYCLSARPRFQGCRLDKVLSHYSKRQAILCVSPVEYLRVSHSLGKSKNVLDVQSVG